MMATLVKSRHGITLEPADGLVELEEIGKWQLTGTIVEKSIGISALCHDGPDTSGEEAGRDFQPAKQLDDVCHVKGRVLARRRLAAECHDTGVAVSKKVKGRGREALENLEPVDEVCDGHGVVGAQCLETDEGQAAQQRNLDASSACRADVALQFGDGFVVLLDNEDVQAVASKAFDGHGVVRTLKEREGGPNGDKSMLDGVILVVGARVGRDSQAVPEVGERADVFGQAVDLGRPEAVEEALLDLGPVDVRRERPHRPQRLAPLARPDELDLGLLGGAATAADADAAATPRQHQ